MGPFEEQVECLVEGPGYPAGRSGRITAAVNEVLSLDERKIFERLAKAWLAFEPYLSDESLSDLELWKQHGGVQVVLAAKDLAYHVLRTRQPPRNVRKLSEVAKEFTTLRRRPRDVREYFERNRSGLLMLLSAKNWERAPEGITVEGITVSDTTGRGGLDEIVKLVQSVASQIRRSGLPRAKDLLYGHIYITANLTVRGSKAFYRRRQDTIWIRPRTRWGPANEHSLTHELGHRYWHRFLPASSRAAWKEWDRSLREHTSEAPVNVFPRVGEPVPMRVRGHGNHPPVVTRITGNRFFIGPTSFVTRQQIRRFHAIQAERSKFPTEYAQRTGDAEEHFCEAFAMRVLGTLEGHHLSNFREIIG